MLPDLLRAEFFPLERRPTRSRSPGSLAVFLPHRTDVAIPAAPGGVDRHPHRRLRRVHAVVSMHLEGGPLGGQVRPLHHLERDAPGAVTADLPQHRVQRCTGLDPRAITGEAPGVRMEPVTTEQQVGTAPGHPGERQEHPRQPVSVRNEPARARRLERHEMEHPGRHQLLHLRGYG